MLTSIADQILTYWKTGRKVKSSPSGWVSGNAPCCHHNGETPDTRGRGGFLTQPDGTINYHCFNCGYKTGYVPGWHVSFKLKKLLRWMGVDETEIRRLVIDSIRVRDLIGVVQPKANDDIYEKIEFEARELPGNSINLMDMLQFYNDNPKQFQNPKVIGAVEYLLSRRVDLSKYKFFWDTKADAEAKNRIVIPFYHEHKLVGYTTHANFKTRIKYINHVDSNYVFNLDQQTPNRKIVIVTEGTFDALSLDCVAVLNNEINLTQAELISRLNKEVIVVPHWDKPGRKMIDSALEYEWNVSFPLWAETCKDINDAIKKYGKLFVLKSIIDSVETNPTKIKLMAKGLR